MHHSEKAMGSEHISLHNKSGQPLPLWFCDSVMESNIVNTTHNKITVVHLVNLHFLTTLGNH